MGSGSSTTSTPISVYTGNATSLKSQIKVYKEFENNKKSAVKKYEIELRNYQNELSSIITKHDLYKFQVNEFNCDSKLKYERIMVETTKRKYNNANNEINQIVNLTTIQEGAIVEYLRLIQNLLPMTLNQFGKNVELINSIETLCNLFDKEFNEQITIKSYFEMHSRCLQCIDVLSEENLFDCDDIEVDEKVFCEDLLPMIKNGIKKSQNELKKYELAIDEKVEHKELELATDEIKENDIDEFNRKREKLKKLKQNSKQLNFADIKFLKDTCFGAKPWKQEQIGKRSDTLKNLNVFCPIMIEYFHQIYKAMELSQHLLEINDKMNIKQKEIMIKNNLNTENEKKQNIQIENELLINSAINILEKNVLSISSNNNNNKTVEIFVLGLVSTFKDIIKCIGNQRKSVLLANEILSYKPANINIDADIYWQDTDKLRLNIFKHYENILVNSNKFIRFLLQFESSFDKFNIDSSKIAENLDEFKTLGQMYSNSLMNVNNEIVAYLNNLNIIGDKNVESALKNIESYRNNYINALEKYNNKKKEISNEYIAIVKNYAVIHGKYVKTTQMIRIINNMLNLNKLDSKEISLRISKLENDLLNASDYTICNEVTITSYEFKDIGRYIKKIPIIGGLYEIGEGIYIGIKTGDWEQASLQIAGGLISTIFECTPEGFAAKCLQTAVEIPMEIERDRWQNKAEQSRNKATKELDTINLNIEIIEKMRYEITALNTSLGILNIELEKPSNKFAAHRLAISTQDTKQLNVLSLALDVDILPENAQKAMNASMLGMGMIGIISAIKDLGKLGTKIAKKIGSFIGNVKAVTKGFKAFGKVLKGVAIGIGAIISATTLGLEIQHYKDSYNSIEKCRRNINKNGQKVGKFLNDMKKKVQPICDSFITAFPNQDATIFNVNNIEGMLKYINQSITYLKHLELNIIVVTSIMDANYEWKSNKWLRFEKLQNILKTNQNIKSKWHDDVNEMDSYLSAMCQSFFEKMYKKPENYNFYVIAEVFDYYQQPMDTNKLKELYAQWQLINGHIVKKENMNNKKNKFKDKITEIKDLIRKAHEYDDKIVKLNESLLNFKKILNHRDVSLIIQPGIERILSFQNDYLMEIRNHKSELNNILSTNENMDFNTGKHKLDDILYEFYFQSDDKIEELKNLLNEIDFMINETRNYLKKSFPASTKLKTLQDIINCLNLLTAFFTTVKDNINAVFNSFTSINSFPQNKDDVTKDSKFINNKPIAEDYYWFENKDYWFFGMSKYINNKVAVLTTNEQMEEISKFHQLLTKKLGYDKQTITEALLLYNLKTYMSIYNIVQTKNIKYWWSPNIGVSSISSASSTTLIDNDLISKPKINPVFEFVDNEDHVNTIHIYHQKNNITGINVKIGQKWKTTLVDDDDFKNDLNAMNIVKYECNKLDEYFTEIVCDFSQETGINYLNFIKNTQVAEDSESELTEKYKVEGFKNMNKLTGIRCQTVNVMENAQTIQCLCCISFQFS